MYYASRPRPLGDDSHREKKQRKRNERFCERYSLRTEVLAGVFIFLLLILLSTSLNKNAPVDNRLLRIRQKLQKRLHLTETQTNSISNFIPSGDHKVLEWLRSSERVKILRSQNNGILRFGLINFVKPDVIKWKEFSGDHKPTLFSTNKEFTKPLRSTSLSWSDFFPEELDSDEEIQNQRCPDMPFPVVQEDLKLDIIIVSLTDSCDSSRDINNLQASLSAAYIAAKTGTKSMHIVVVGECQACLSVFKCKELVEHQDGVWMYGLDLDRVRKLLSLPVGSCKAALPPSVPIRASREAYATILHSVGSYVCGAIMLAHSIRKTGSTRDLVLLVDDHISTRHKNILEASGWKVHRIERIKNPQAKHLSYNEWNYSKFRLWQLTQYDKLIFVDADVVVVRNMDFLFSLPELSAARNHGSLFNSGVMVIEPSNCTFDYLVNQVGRIHSYNGGDQGFLNEVFTYWHRLPRSVNFLKHFDDNIEENTLKLKMFTANPPVVYAMHYLGTKPWLCGRAYDCNYNHTYTRPYANDVVHSLWWHLYDEMPRGLRKFCRRV